MDGTMDGTIDRINEFAEEKLRKYKTLLEFSLFVEKQSAYYLKNDINDYNTYRQHMRQLCFNLAQKLKKNTKFVLADPDQIKRTFFSFPHAVNYNEPLPLATGQKHKGGRPRKNKKYGMTNASKDIGSFPFAFRGTFTTFSIDKESKSISNLYWRFTGIINEENINTGKDPNNQSEEYEVVKNDDQTAASLLKDKELLCNTEKFMFEVYDDRHNLIGGYDPEYLIFKFTGLGAKRPDGNHPNPDFCFEDSNSPHDFLLCGKADNTVDNKRPHEVRSGGGSFLLEAEDGSTQQCEFTIDSGSE